MPHSEDQLEHVPVEKWPTLQDLAEDFGEHLMAPSNGLVGSSLALLIDNELSVRHDFQSPSQLTWSVENGKDAGLSGHAQYQSFEVRPEIYFIDFSKPDYDENVSIIFNKRTNQSLVAISKFCKVDGQRRTTTTILQARVKDSESVEPYQISDELIGKRILYRYTAKDAYEHIYLNRGTMTWHCLDGTEKGLADTERCQVFKLSEKLYLLFWSETIMPVESVVVVDLQEMRSTGRFFCWDPKPQQAVHVRFGSFATFLGESNVMDVLNSLRK
ncbi:MoaF C-terminal domain-containing protein [Elsinoe australis]|uniref:MoaF C-terminal domain-containing protein n=1 Tax=Elsinoe australis TaxID=40998 RepID=A0A4U7ATD9_9PEZI|nr:MoaF C-terminal domain-containing protein [Elsinoe australis]